MSSEITREEVVKNKEQLDLEMQIYNNLVHLGIIKESKSD